MTVLNENFKRHNPDWDSLPGTRLIAKILSIPRYFLSNKPCTKGHTVPRNTAAGQCLHCRQIMLRKYHKLKTRPPKEDFTTYNQAWAELPSSRIEARNTGAKRYFVPNKPCLNDHNVPRSANSGRCLLCEQVSSPRTTTTIPGSRISLAMVLPNGCVPVGNYTQLVQNDDSRRMGCKYYIQCCAWAWHGTSAPSWICGEECKFK